MSAADFPIFIVDAEGKTTLLDPASSRSGMLLFRDIRQAIGAYTAEVVRLKDGSVLLVDEDGLARGLPVNPKASKWAGCPIVGTVAFVPKGLVKRVLG
jgi:hypothetical protein